MFMVLMFAMLNMESDNDVISVVCSDGMTGCREKSNEEVGQGAVE